MPVAKTKPKAKPKAVTREMFDTPLIMGDDGALKRPKAEEFALMLADGLTPVEGWKAIHQGQTNPNGSSLGERRRYMERDPVFQRRLEHLVAEKEETLSDSVFGDARWMTKQLWRRAVLANDIGQMSKAAELMFKMQERAAPSAPSRGAGAPSVENPQSRRDIAGIRQELINKGVPMEAGSEESAGVE